MDLFEAVLEVDGTGRFTPMRRCDCSPEHFFSRKITWEEVPMRYDSFDGPYKPGWMHHAVEVIFECHGCGRLFTRVYENLEQGKFARDGFYALRRRVKKLSDEVAPFAHFEKSFEAARDDYHFILYNCYHWARDFFFANTVRGFTPRNPF